MVNNEDYRFGPHTVRVEELLGWIDRGELLRFGKPLFGPFIPVPNLIEALALMQRKPDQIDWTELRENAESALYEVGTLDTPEWLPWKSGIEELLSVVAEKVEAGLAENYLDIIDDVIADLHACSLCLAVQGKFDPFHERLWKAYDLGGWPCGCSGEVPDSDDDELELEDRKFYILWSPNV